MAIVKNPYGDLRKRLGNTVTLINGGINIIRKMPGQVKDRKTPLQMQQRFRFTTLTQMGKALQRTLELGYTSRGVLTGPFAQFIKENKENVSVTGTDVCTVNYSKLLVSKGVMPKYNMSVTYDSELSEFAFLQEPYEFNNKYELTAKAYGVLYNEVEGQEKCCVLKEVAEGGTTQIMIPNGWKKEDVHVYTFTRSEKYGVSSKSVYHEL